MKTPHQPVRTHSVSDRVNHHPNHPMVKSWLFGAFKDDQEQAWNEANLADAMAHVASDNGVSANTLQHLFPAVLRMLKSNSDWTK